METDDDVIIIKRTDVEDIVKIPPKNKKPKKPINTLTYQQIKEIKAIKKAKRKAREACREYDEWQRSIGRRI